MDFKKFVQQTNPKSLRDAIKTFRQQGGKIGSDKASDVYRQVKGFDYNPKKAGRTKKPPSFADFIKRTNPKTQTEAKEKYRAIGGKVSDKKAGETFRRTKGVAKKHTGRIKYFEKRRNPTGKLFLSRYNYTVRYAFQNQNGAVEYRHVSVTSSKKLTRKKIIEQLIEGFFLPEAEKYQYATIIMDSIEVLFGTFNPEFEER